MNIKKSIWKYPFDIVKHNFFKVGENIIKCQNRNLTLTTKFLNKTLRCHKGKVTGKILIQQQHLGYKLGEFFITKILGERIAYRKKQKAIMKKNKNKQKQVVKKK
jgi:ribosomal protein S19